MYGGLSLAIHIDGVSLELFRAVRGQGVHRLVKALTDSDIVVDVISGASAGGINGIALAAVLANGTNFQVLSKKWRGLGSIHGLLRSPREETDSSNSLSNTEGYYVPHPQQAFMELARAGDGHEEHEEYEDGSPISEIDVFVAGTTVAGNHPPNGETMRLGAAAAAESN
jgi:hypothetical protein